MPFDAGNTPGTAFNLGSFNGGQSTQRSEEIGTWIPNIGRDLNDYYEFTISSDNTVSIHTVSIRLDRLTDNAELELLNRNGSVRRSSRNSGVTSEEIVESLRPGTYYIRVYPATPFASTPYRLSVQSTSSSFADASNSPESATNLGTYDGRTTTVSQAIGGGDRDDYYRFDLKERRNVSLRLNGLRADAGLELFNQVNQIVARSYQAGTAEESIRTILDPGTYRLRVFSFDGVETNYNLSVSDNNLSVLEQLQSPTLIRAGTLGADQFTLTPGYRRYVFSGNGNVDYGAGLFDRLDLSAFSSSSVRWNPVTANGTGGVRYNPGNGDRLFDQLLLSDGREILLEGIEKIVFQNESLATGFINAGLTVNPSDPLFTRQWNLHMMGVHTAWRFTTGSNSVLIGVQDGGIALTNEGKSHPDFRSNAMHTTPGNDSADDFFDVPKNKPDLFGHGTAVLGIIAAASNNGTGMSGINWVSPVISADVLGGNRGDISSEQAIRQWAEATQPVGGSGQRMIINMSFTGPVSEDFRNLVRQYQDRILFVISSGNDSQSTLPTPSVLASNNLNVIAVGASWGKTDAFGQSRTPGTRIEYPNSWASQYGPGLTVMAPSEHITTRATLDPRTGQVIFNTYPNNPASPLTNSQLRQLQNLDLAFNGTSAAAPNVTGIASLVWSANPTLTAAQVRQILSETAINVGTPGYDLFTGYGFVNADAAVRRAMAIARA